MLNNHKKSFDNFGNFKSLKNFKDYIKYNFSLGLRTAITKAIVAISCLTLAYDPLLAENTAAENNSLVICIRANNQWVGFKSPNKLYYALLNLESPCLITYKETTLSESELVILNRFLNTRKLFKDLKKNDETSEKQIEIITGVTKTNKKDITKLDVQDILQKTTHISIWDKGEFTELTLGTTAEAREEWSELMPSFLSLLFSPSSRAERLETEGIGFLVPLDKPKKIGEPMSWASNLRNLTYEFEQVGTDSFNKLPPNLKTMLAYNGFIVPLSTQDLRLMSSLKWEEYPEDIKETTGIPLEKSGMIWWGLIDYKGKNYGINAWETCSKVD